MTGSYGFERCQIEALETASEIIRAMAESDATGLAGPALEQIADTLEDVAAGLALDVLEATCAGTPSVSLEFIEVINATAQDESGDGVYILDICGIHCLPAGTVIEAVDYFPHRFQKLPDGGWVNLSLDKPCGEPGFSFVSVWRVLNPVMVGLVSEECAA